MRKLKKSKIVLVSILGLGAISIGSVGFATWLVGVNKTNEELHIEAVVDNTMNDSIYLDVTVDSSNKFVVAESAEKTKGTGDIVGAKANSSESLIKVDGNAMKFTFTRFELSIGEGVANKPKQVKVEFDSTLNAFNWTAVDTIRTASCTVVSGESTTTQIIGNKRSTDSKYSYITYSQIFTIGTHLIKDEERSTGSYSLYALKSDFLTQQFSWGTFFTRSGQEDSESPVSFYNNIYKDYNDNSKSTYMTGAQTFGFADKINTEIQALNSTFSDENNKTLKIKASVILPQA